MGLYDRDYMREPPPEKPKHRLNLLDVIILVVIVAAVLIRWLR